jgi:hypothetical protein
MADKCQRPGSVPGAGRHRSRLPDPSPQAEGAAGALQQPAGVSFTHRERAQSLRRTEGGENGKGSRGRGPRGRAEGEGAAPRREGRRLDDAPHHPADAGDHNASRLAELRATCDG